MGMNINSLYHWSLLLQYGPVAQWCRANVRKRQSLARSVGFPTGLGQHRLEFNI